MVRKRPRQVPVSLVVRGQQWVANVLLNLYNRLLSVQRGAAGSILYGEEVADLRQRADSSLDHCGVCLLPQI